MKSATEKGVSVKAKNISGEGFSVRFTKRPSLKKKPEETKAPEQTQSQDAEMMKPEMPSASPTLAETRLWVAARGGDCYTIRMLVMEGVDLESRDIEGRTAFNIATQYNQQNALKTLLAAREMRRMAATGDLPQSKFFNKFGAKA